MSGMGHLLIFIGLAGLCIVNGKAECGYQSCHPIEKDHLNIHLVPHSHDDMGYKKTVEQYYYGSHDDVQSAGVQYILNSVIDALQRDRNRRFIYVETGFFWKWWLQQDDNMRSQVKQLVNNGQLEFIGGGWSMNDEATTYYQEIIDQMTWGLRKLNETFGECGRPKVAWQIDPFGHSREMASIFAQIGFDGFFLNRIDYQDHDARMSNRSMEFIWRGSPENLGDTTDIFTNVLFQHYKAPSGLCFDVLCKDEPIIDDPNSPEYNVEKKVQDFISKWITPAKQGYASNNILVPMGEDFQYQYAGKNFLNMDKLIKYMNGKDFDGVKYNVIYSTPSCYLNAVYQSTNGKLESGIKTDDFFPYASAAHTYWTGYFSSRPTGKGYSRYSNNFLQICKQLSVLTNLTSAEDSSKLDSLRESLATFQHHDGITGTERENVAHDYIRMLHNGITNCEEVTKKALTNLVHAKNMTFTTCPMLNVSQCVRTEKEDTLIVTIYNPLGKFVDKIVKLPIVDNASDISITDPSGEKLVTQIIPIHPSIINVPGRNSTAQYNLYFRATNIPPLGYKSFFYQRHLESAQKHVYNAPQKNENALEVTHSSKGTETVITNQDRLKVSVGTAYYYYTGFIGNASSPDFNPSQAYVFRPDPDIPIQPVSKDYSFITYAGPLLTETHWYFNEWLSYIHRNVVGSSISEFSHLVGEKLVTQIIPIHPSIINVPGRNSTAQYNLYFRATNIPPLGYKSFFYQRHLESAQKHVYNAPQKNENALEVTHSSKGTETVITNQDRLKVSVGTAYYYYTGFIGNASSPDFNPSQAYVFRPDPDIPIQPVSKDYSFITYAGPLLTETHWYFNEWLSYIHRNVVGSSISEFSHLVGPLPYHDKGIEVVARFNTDLKYDDSIYTDTNGREHIKRTRNFRPTWNVTITEPESGNYYPVTSVISLTDSNRTAGFAVVNDRAQGGGSMDYQNIELMIHRNTINISGGMGEALNEQAFGTGVVSLGSHYLMFTGSDLSSAKDSTPKEVAQEIAMDSWLFFASPNGLSFENYKKAHVMEFSGLANTSLPRNVHLLTLEPLGPSVILLRLENFVGKEDTWNSGTSTVNIREMFSAFNVVSLKETTLGGNQWLQENSRIQFNRASNKTPKVVQSDDEFNVILEPMQMRTFIVTISN